MTGKALEEGKQTLMEGGVDLSLLDAKVEELCAKMLLTFPDCTTKTIEELRKPKLEAWNRNKENARAWLALNMMTEARAGFTAFNEGPKDDREVDFIALRQALARDEGWVDPLHEAIQPRRASAHERAAPAMRRTAGPLKVWLERDGALLRLRLARPKANIIDAPMIAALVRRFASHRESRACSPCSSTPRGRISPSARASRSTCRSTARRCWPACTRSWERCSNGRCRSWSRCAASAWAAGWSSPWPGT